MSFTTMIATVVTLAFAQPALAQGPPDEGPSVPAPSLDSLVASALATHPDLQAAGDRVAAAQGRVSPAGALPDPVLSVGLRNFPIRDPGFGDLMTMKTLGLSQTLPFPGKRSLARSSREREVEAYEAGAVSERARIVAEVQLAYFELASLDGTLEVLERTRDVLSALVQAAAAWYEAGDGRQEDVLIAQVELAMVADEAVAVTERRRGSLSRMEVLVGGSLDDDLIFSFPDRITALGSASADGRFTSSRLGARLADSPLPSIQTLLESVSQSNPEAAVHRSRISAQRDRLELANMAHLPDFSVSLSYAERSDRTDMISLMVSVPLAVHRGSNQSSVARAAEAELGSLSAAHAAHLDRVRVRVSELHARAESRRTSLMLLQASILPLGRAAVEAASAGFAAGRTEFDVLLESQLSIHRYEIMFLESLSGFASLVAELERAVGQEILK